MLRLLFGQLQHLSEALKRPAPPSSTHLVLYQDARKPGCCIALDGALHVDSIAIP